MPLGSSYLKEYSNQNIRKVPDGFDFKGAEIPPEFVYKKTKCTKFLWLDFIFH